MNPIRPIWQGFDVVRKYFTSPASGTWARSDAGSGSSTERAMVTPQRGWLAGLKSSPHLILEPSTPDNLSVDPDAIGARRGSGAVVDRFGEVLPFVDYDGDRRLFLLEADGPGKYEGLGYTLEVTPQTGASEQMAAAMLNLVTAGCPPGTGIQCTLFASPRIDDYLDQLRTSCVDPSRIRSLVRDPNLRRQMVDQADTFRSLMRRRCEFYARGALSELHPGSNLRFRDFRGFLSVVYPARNPKDPQVLHDVLSLRQSHITTLQQYGLYGGTRDIEVFLYYMSMMLNPHRMMRGDRPVLTYDPLDEPRNQLVAPDTRIDLHTDRLDFYSRPDKSDAFSAICMSVRSYPQIFTLHSMSNLLGALNNTKTTFPCPFVITCGVNIPDYEALKNSTQLKAAAAQRNAELDFAKYMPHLKEVNADWKIAQHAFDQGKGLVRMYLQTVLFAPPSDLQRIEEIARAVWRSSLFELSSDAKIQSQAFLSTLPMLNGPLLSKDMKLARRSTTKTAFNAANMMPLVGEWKGTAPRPNEQLQVPIIPLVGRRGQMMPIDPYANSSGNPNCIVVGASNSGKSVLMNELACGVLRTGGHVWIIDIGFSYKKLCEALGGQYIEFTEDTDICLNPWSLVEDIEKDMSVIKGIVIQMLSIDGRIDPYCAAQLELHILDVWLTHGRSATITHLAESLKNNCELGGPNPRKDDPDYRAHVRNLTPEERAKICDPRIRDLGVQLFPFSEDGTYGRYFNGPCNVRFTSNLVVLELEQLKAKPHLQAVVMMLLMNIISAKVYLGDPSIRKAVLLDEAWALLREGDAATFIGEMYRRIRKYGGLVATASQSLADYESPSARASRENADVVFLLRQKQSSIDHAARTGILGMDEHQRALLSSVTKAAGQFSEIYVKLGESPAVVGRLMLDHFTLLLYSTDPPDKAAIQFYRDAGLSLAAAIEAVLRDRGQLLSPTDDPSEGSDVAPELELDEVR